MIIGCDIDGVIADTAPPIERRIAEHFGLDVSEVTVNKYAMHERFGIDPVVMKEFLQTSVYEDPDTWLEAEPYRENIKALRAISQDRIHDIIFITGRREHARRVTESWFYKHGVPFNGLLMSAIDVKHKIMKHAGCEFFIEDRFAEALTIADQGYRSYCVRRPYNASQQLDRGVFWVDDIWEVFKLEGLVPYDVSI